MRAHLGDAARLHHHNPVHAGDGGEAMGDGDDGFTLHQTVERGLDCGLDL